MFWEQCVCLRSYVTTQAHRVGYTRYSRLARKKVHSSHKKGLCSPINNVYSTTYYYKIIRYLVIYQIVKPYLLPDLSIYLIYNKIFPNLKKVTLLQGQKDLEI